MYDTSCSSRPPPFESDDFNLFLQHLLHSSSSTSTSSTFVTERNKPLNHHLYAPPFHNRLDSDRVASASTDDSAPEFVLPTELKNVGNSGGGVCETEAGVGGSVKRRKLPVENNEFDDFDCESEEGLEGSDGMMKSNPSRSSSKRSRAAEVHNLSEKRRRSRINEKMKALQNLIPNSNKTDKASMLDEAIEYLKQLQLQVQMLSMRNGFSMHPMYFPGVLQPPQLPQARLGFSEGNGLPPHIPVNPECSTQTSFGLSNQCTTSNQPMVNITPSETTYSLDSSSLHGHQGSFQMPTTSEEIYREQLLRQQQYYANHTLPNQSGDNNKMKSAAATSLPFDGGEHPNCVHKEMDY
ncbi:hypothetical protein ACHQM5_016123 [Ranunculus cassubicifolius]